MSFSNRTNPLAIDDLKPGMAIIAIEAQNGPVKLRKSGLVKSQDMVNGLKEMGVLSLNIDWDNSIEIDDAPPHADDLSNSPMTTRQLFDDEQTSRVNNAMSDQFNRSLFLPSLQALPSQFSVISKYSAQYVGMLFLGLALGYGAAQLLPTHHEAVVAVPALTPATPVSSAAETTVPETAQIEAVEPLTSESITSEPAEIEAEEQGIFVTQTAEKAEEAPVSAAMAARVNQALESLGGLDNLTAAAKNKDNLRPSTSTERATTVEVVDKVQGVAQLPEHILVQLPAMVFSAHMYSSTDEDRWVRVNNRRLQEGGRVDNNVRIVRIEPQYVVLSFRGTEFKMAALTDW
jgi:general secretion pathway protein B